MEEIEKIARQFREAIDVARSADKFRGLYPFYKFPDDCCEHSCDLLGQYLLEHGIETTQVNGAYKHNRVRHHVWLTTEDRIVIDITADQFIDELVSKDEVEEVHVGREGTIHKMFCCDRVFQNNTIFTDVDRYNGFGGCPDARQKRLIDLYKIICQEI